MPETHCRLSGFSSTLLLGLLACLPQAAARCGSIICPPGFKCCYNTCCRTQEYFNSFSIFIVVILSTVPLLCLCGVVTRVCCKCKDPEPELDLTADYATTPSMTQPRTPPEIRASIPEHPPPYHEVVVKPDEDLSCREPPPPYSFRPEGYCGSSGGIDNPAF